MVVDAWSARAAKGEVPQQWNDFLIACLSSSRARAVQQCVQKRIPWLRRRAFRDVRAPCVDYRM
eukprot:2374419-Lingulodinium_polyedra.AAC.1